jgi:hypothetical protein
VDVVGRHWLVIVLLFIRVCLFPKTIGVFNKVLNARGVDVVILARLDSICIVELVLL